MTAVEDFGQIFPSNSVQFSKKEKILLEVECITRVYDELRDFFKNHYKTYFQIMKLTMEQENAMIEKNFMRCVIHDILATEEYTLVGIANYTETHEDVIHEVVLGRNNNPSFLLSRKLLELHRLTRPDLYRDIFQKIKTSLLGDS